MIPFRILLFFLLCFSFGTVMARRLPRGFSPAMYCSACRAVATEIHSAFSVVDPNEMIDSGSYRLSSTGKQPGRKKVPYKGSDLHITTVLDNVCEKISDKFVRFEEYPDVFVEKNLKGDIDANSTEDCKPVRSLYGLCSNIVDDNEEKLQNSLRGRADLGIKVWTEEFCGADGIVAGACLTEIDPGSGKDVIAFLKLEQERKANEANGDGGYEGENEGESERLQRSTNSGAMTSEARELSKEEL